MDKRKLIQLRNHHLKQGKNNDRTPIYPITVPEAITNLKEYLEGIGVGSDILIVEELPGDDDVEVGKVYYNSTDNTFYVYDINQGFVSVGNPSMRTIKEEYGDEIAHISQGQTVMPNGFILEPDNLYDLTGYITGLANIQIELAHNDEVYARCYTWRVTFPNATFGIALPSTLVIPDTTHEVLDGLEANHTYEFNVFGNVLLVVDITETPAP